MALMSERELCWLDACRSDVPEADFFHFSETESYYYKKYYLNVEPSNKTSEKYFPRFITFSGTVKGENMKQYFPRSSNTLSSAFETQNFNTRSITIDNFFSAQW